jgi:hypothetical protein
LPGAAKSYAKRHPATLEKPTVEQGLARESTA